MQIELFGSVKVISKSQLMKNLIGKHLLALFLLTICFSTTYPQQWEREILGDRFGATALTELPNEDLVYLQGQFLGCSDRFGTPQWSLDILNAAPPMELSPRHLASHPNGDIAVIASDSASGREMLLTLSPQGILQSIDTLELNFILTEQIAPFPDGRLAILGTRFQGPVTLAVFDRQGDTVWTKSYPNGPSFRTPMHFTTTRDSAIVLTGTQQDTTTYLFAAKLRFDGSPAWENTFFQSPILFSSPYGVLEAPDSTLHILTSVGLIVSPPALTTKLTLSAVGDSLTNDTTGLPLGAGLTATTDGDGYATYRRTNSLSNDFGLQLFRYDWNTNLQWGVNHLIPGRRIVIREVIPLADSGFAAAGQIWEGPSGPSIGTYLARLDRGGRPFENLLVGRAYYDANGNCVPDPGERNVPGLILQITGDTNLVFSTDSDGNLRQALNTGSYTLNAFPNYNYWKSATCAVNTPVNFPSTGDTTFIEFPLEPDILCPDLRVDLTATPLVVCFSNYYQVSYENVGSDTADNAYVDVIMPPSVTVDSATLPIALNLDSLYRFTLGSIAPLQTGDFRIYVTADCPPNPLDLLGRTECAFAAIYPDTNCLPTNSGWDGSSVGVELTCLPNDSLRFVIRNNSNAGMSSPGGYLVLEDNIMRINNSFQLGANDSLEFFEPGNGATWTLVADQSPGHPGNSYPIISVEGCGTDTLGNISLGFVPQFPLDDNELNIAVYCGTYLGAYDPNDKLATPEGIGPLHAIEKDQEIDYTVRFQNTGSFFAFNVIVFDTLDPRLDLTTFRMTATSHPANWQILPGGILRVEYPDINLPDSTRDEPNSHGFFRFSIFPDQSLQPGDRFEGRAAIYFDFNPPIITNTVFHTISDTMYGVVSVDTPRTRETLPITVYPNPFRERTTFRLTEPLQKGAQFELRNLSGQLVYRQDVGPVREFDIAPGALPSGLYFFRLQDARGRPATGKLLLQR